MAPICGTSLTHRQTDKRKEGKKEIMNSANASSSNNNSANNVFANPINTKTNATNLASTIRRRPPPRVELTDEQKAEIREAFEIFDMDKDGALDFHEFKVRDG